MCREVLANRFPVVLIGSGVLAVAALWQEESQFVSIGDGSLLFAQGKSKILHGAPQFELGDDLPCKGLQASSLLDAKIGARSVIHHAKGPDRRTLAGDERS